MFAASRLPDRLAGSHDRCQRADENNVLWVDSKGELYPIGEAPRQTGGQEKRRAQCPICGDRKVYLSGWRSFRELLARGSGMRPYRCHQCGTRFLDRVGLSCYGAPGDVMLLPPEDAPAGEERDPYVM
ncbi:MAG: hypothetical protein ABI383_13970 [Acidobacteriaceae bacterium]